MGKLAGKVALITGASRGIGAAVARRYAEEGAQLVLVARTVGGLEAIDDYARSLGTHATIVPLDLSKEHDLIDVLGQQLSERYGKLDILVGNAAMLGGLSPIPHVTPKVFEQIFALNVTANWRLLRSLDALLRAAPAGRAMFVTSGAADGDSPFWGPYAASKSALETLVATYANEVAISGVRANLIDPGVVRTAMRASAFPGENPATLPAPEDITEAFVQLALASENRHGEVVSVRSFQKAA